MNDHEVTIVVNGRPKVVSKKAVLAVPQVIALAFDNPPSGENVQFTITYRKAESKPHEGTMSGSDTVEVKEGTVFNVTATDKS